MSSTVPTTPSTTDGPTWPPLPPARLKTLVHIARWRAEQQPDDLAYTFLVDGDRDEAHLRYHQLDRRARAVAAELQARGLADQRVLLVFNPGLDFNAAVFGCLYAGAVAVPVYPPDPFRAQRTLPRLQAIVKDAQAALVLGCEEVLHWAGQTIENGSGAQTLVQESIPDDRWQDWEPFTPKPDRLALLQYTSGSTGSPRGVMLTHGNLMHNLGALHRLDVEDAVAVCWVPPFHDMGLIGGLMLPVHSGRQVVLMSPLSFIQHPVRWLWAMSRYRARTSPSPNFGYELCIRKVRPDECEGLDLSAWTAAINGAEPVRADTIDRFVEKFAPYGFRRETFYPAFGMAESTLLVTGGRRGDPVVAPTLSASALEENRVREVDPDDPDGRRFVGCGQPLPDGRIAIVDPQTCRRLPHGQVGEIWVRSPSVGRGYWNRPQESQRVFGGRIAEGGKATYLRTGDLGFVHRGELFVTGRLKELIILAGRNYYPQDVELLAARSHPALKPDGQAAFSVDVAGQEQLVLVAEVLRPKRWDLEEVLQALRRELAEELDLVPHALLLIPVGALPKTSSGKTRRRACRRAFLDGELRTLAHWSADVRNPDARSAVSPDDRPRTPLEQTLARLFSEVLAVEPVGRNDDFFALGGQSLRAMQLAGRISAELRVEVSLPLLFRHATVAGMAQWIETHANGRARPGAGSSRPAIRRRSPQQPAPLSSAEQRLWFFDQFQPNHPFYNMPVAARLTGPLDVDVLQRCLAELVARHDTLRTVYPAHDGQPRRRVLPDAEVPLVCVDLEHVEAEHREAELRCRLAEQSRLPFDLAAGPLARFCLFRLAPRQHVLLLAMHHIVVDGWSMGVLAGELGALYEARAAGRPCSLPPLEIDYADFAAWQHQQLESGALQREAAYWRQQLADEPPALQLPTDRPRPPQQTFRGALHPVEFSAELSRRTAQLAASERTTPFAVLLAAYNCLLARYCRQDDIAVGTVCANRTRKQLEGLVGFFANTLVLRSDLSGDPTFRQLLGRVSQTALEAYDNQQLPFDKLVELLAPQRHSNQAPLFQVALVLENMPLQLGPRSGIQAQPIPVDNGTAKYDLALLLGEESGKLVGQVEYSTDLFDGDTIDRMVFAMQTLLEAALADPDQTISRLPLLDAAQRRRTLADCGATDTEPAPSECLHQLVEQHARRNPDRPAVRCGSRLWTYAELDRRANRIARHLIARGVAADQPVAVCLPRSAESVVAALGVLKAAGAYLPLDPALPPPRLDFLLKDTQAPLVISSRALAGSLPVTAAAVLPIEDLLEEPPPAAGQCDDSLPPTCNVRPEHLAYILYTSGSTGRPKGVLIEHRGAVNFIRGFSRVLRIDAESRVLHFFSASSDGTISDVFSALTTGACLVIAGPDIVKQDDGLQNLMHREQVTTATLTPSMMPLVDPQQLPELVTVCSVGEAAAADFARRWSRPGRTLINGYGVTEASCGACMAEVSGPAAERTSIGRPLEHVAMYVLDDHLEPLPPGVLGEICIGGIQVGRGYLNRPQLTARCFVPDPFRHQPDARLYRTGDLGLRRPDGRIELLGRIDNQVNLRGHRVEPDGIAALLQRHPDVAQAAVIAREDQPGQLRLVGYVVPKSAGSDSSLVSELRRYLQARLPHFTVPTAWVALERLPRTVQGKLDRRALPAPVQDRQDAADFVAPADDQQRLVAAVWEELLDVRPVGTRDNFFELGGHSMLAVRVMAEIERRAGRRIPLAALFQEPTVEHLARLLRQPAHADPGQSLVPLATRGTGRPLFCIHPAGGTVFCYRDLAERLGPSRPVFGLQAVGIDGLRPPQQSAEEMAAHYIRAIRARQPRGPYSLAGWSLGGNLAYEMARQLTADGQSIALLALLDAAALPADRKPDEDDFLPMLMEFFPDQENLPLDEIRALPLAGQLDYFVQRAAQAGIVGVDMAAAGHVFEVFKTSMQAILNVRQQPYSGKVTLLAAENRESWFGGTPDAHLGWDRWATEVEAHRIPGGHIQMVHPPNVEILAEKLRECLAQADVQAM